MRQVGAFSRLKIAKGLQNVKVLVTWRPFGGIFFEKSLTVPKNSKGDTLVSPGIVCHAEKKEKSFWFSFLGQQVQFKIL